MQGVYYLGNISSAGIFIAGFVINFFIYRAGGAYFFDLILSTTAIASGNTIGAIVGAHFLERKVLFNNRTFFRLERIFSFLFFVVFIPSVITSFTGGLATYLSGLADGVFQKIHSWLVADLIGVLVFVPLIITWIESPELKINRHKILEFSILLILLIISNYFIFSDFFKNHLYNILIAYFSTPLYIWLAFRFEKKVIASILFLALVYISYLALYSGNTFMSDLVQKPYILLQGFSIVISVLILIVHSIYTERQEFIVEIRRSEQNLKAVLTNLPLGVGILNSEGEPEFLNKEFSEKTNLYLDDFKSPKVINESRKYEKNAVYFLTNFWKTFIESFSLNENIEKDISILNKHHEAIDFSLNINPLKDRYLLVMMDITQRKKMLNRIKEDERRLSSLIKNLQGMVYQCRFDRNWTMEFVSEGSFLLTGYLPSDFIYNSRIPYASIIDEKYRDYVWDTIESTPASSSRFFITAEG